MIYSITSQKGGVGKSSTTLSLAAGLAHKNKQTLIVDIDPQSNSSKVMIEQYLNLDEDQTIYKTIIESKELPIHQTKVANLYIVPSHILLSKADSSLAGEVDRYFRLKDQLDKIKSKFEFIFIDTPPNLGVLTLNALTATDKIIVPVSPGFFEFDSISQLSDTIKTVQSRLNSNLEILGYLFTLSQPTVESGDSLNMLRKAFGDKVFKTSIPRNVAMAEAHHRRQDIFSYDKTSRAAEEYNRLLFEIFGI